MFQALLFGQSKWHRNVRIYILEAFVRFENDTSVKWVFAQCIN